MPSDHIRADRIADATDRPDRLQRYKEYREAYETWLATLPESERQRLAELNLEKPQSEQFGAVRRGDEDDEFSGEVAWAADDVDQATDDELEELETAIGRALYWAVAGETIVEVGRRWLMVMHIWRSPLIAGLQLEFERERLEECRKRVGEDDGNGPTSGRLMEWVRRGGSFSQLGQRVLAMAYVMKPLAIGSASLEAIGRWRNNSRQAVDKMVQDFRDSFGGARSRNMRDDDNRLTCKFAQLRRNSTT
ncbi:MAG: hypothetical protein P4L99_28005 [Chthoniobacter sp.]|nr:hypothetical protein [Chthoniobacter sp.]